MDLQLTTANLEHLCKRQDFVSVFNGYDDVMDSYAVHVVVV